MSLNRAMPQNIINMTREEKEAKAKVLLDFFKTPYSKIVACDGVLWCAVHKQAERAINENHKQILRVLLFQDVHFKRLITLLADEAESIYDEVYCDYINELDGLSGKLALYADDLETAPDNDTPVSDEEQAFVDRLESADYSESERMFQKLGKYRKKYMVSRIHSDLLAYDTAFKNYYYPNVDGSFFSVIGPMENGDCDNSVYEYYIGCLRDLAKNLKTHVEEVKMAGA